MGRGPLAHAALGLALGLGVAAAIASATPAGLEGFASSLRGLVSSPAALQAVVLISAPIAVAAAGLTLAYRARFITIASEGQVIAGSAAALWVTAYAAPDLDPALGKAAAVLLASLAGCGVGLAVAALRVALGVNEILSSLMLNYAIMYAVNYLVATAWRVGPFTITRSVPEQYRLSWLEAALAAVAAAVAYWFVVHRTALGYEADVLGRAPRAAATYGVRAGRTIVAASALQGLSGGAAGALLMLGLQHTLTAMSVPPGYGYMGVLVAWLSGLEPLACAPAALLYGFVAMTARLLQAHGVGFGVALAMQSAILLSVVALIGASRLARR